LCRCGHEGDEGEEREEEGLEEAHVCGWGLFGRWDGTLMVWVCVHKVAFANWYLANCERKGCVENVLVWKKTRWSVCGGGGGGCGCG
jgi:hypothetical protein